MPYKVCNEIIVRNIRIFLKYPSGSRVLLAAVRFAEHGFVYAQVFTAA